jgi:transposase
MVPVGICRSAHATFGSRREVVVRKRGNKNRAGSPSRLNRFAVSPLGSCQINCLQQVMPPARNFERIQFMKEFYAGLELASSYFVICVTNSRGQKVFQAKGLSKVGEITRTFRECRSKLNGHLSLNIESGELSVWGRGLATPFIDRVVVTDPRQNHWISRDRQKSDELDAFKLAEILRMGNYKAVYIDESEDRRDFKMVVKHYEAQSRARARAMVLIKARLRTFGIIRKDSRLFHPSQREGIIKQIPSEFNREALLQLFRSFDAATELKRDALRTMKRMSKKFPEVELLITIPGVGHINACRFVAYVQNPHRFNNVRGLWRYAGLGVVQPSSNGRPIGPKRLDSAGCGTLKDVSRKAFEAVMRRKDNNMFSRFYEESMKRTNNSAHARLSVQRKVLSVMRAVWISGTPYRDDLG